MATDLQNSAFVEILQNSDALPCASDLSPTARDLVSNSDRWHELQFKCARMERANMRISNIDLNVTGDGIQYSFGVDDGEEEATIVQPEEEPQNSPAHHFLKDYTPIILERAQSVLPHARNPGEESAVMTKSHSLPSTDLEAPQLNEIQAADPAILRYFSAVEDMMAMADEWEGQDAAESEETSFGTAATPLQDVTDGQQSGRFILPRGVPESPLWQCPTPSRRPLPSPHQLQAQQVLPLRSAANMNIPRPQTPQIVIPKDETDCQSNGQQSGSVQGVESPPWRRPQAARIVGNCNELRPTNVMDVRERSGRKILRNIFKV